MSANDELLSFLRVDGFVSYLEGSGWRLIDHPNDRIFLYEGPPDDDGNPLQIVIPRNHNFEDAKSRMAEAVRLLAEISQESPGSIIRGIIRVGVKSRKPQVDIDSIRGQIIDNIPAIEVWSASELDKLVDDVRDSVQRRALAELDINETKLEQLEEINRVQRIIDELTERLRKEIPADQVAPVDLNEIIHNMNKRLAGLVGDEIELEEQFDPALKLVLADRARIEQVLFNLVLNAREAMPGGGRLTITTKNSIQPAGFVVLEVIDSGSGMNEETRQKIFEPFFTTKSGKGTGLGLAVANHIVKKYGGNISVESQPGQGTTFQIYLPQVEARNQP